MKLPIAIAVLVLVLAANTEAQEAETTMEEHFTNLGEQMKTFAEEIKTKTLNAAKGIHESEFAVQFRSWFEEKFEQAKKHFEETFPKQ